MKQTIRNWLAAIVFVTTMGGMTLSLAAPQTVHAACNDRLLTFPAWYKGLTKDDCDVKSPADVGGVQNFIWIIGLNVVEFILQLVGYVSVGYIIFGGYKFMTSTGSSDGIAKARTTILNAVIGLIISLFSVGIVNIVAGAF